ncbi:RluA family pseudouridine synthase [Candidatus Fermentibacteria bacterium]|nr:RluA family pseudouridine synthase [Candidatus Fermentibacteria bacterium]
MNGDAVAVILFESDEIIAVDKPEGLASVPERNIEIPSLLSLLTERQGQRLYAVHRLDKAASGVILFAKTAEAHRFLNDQFSSRLVEKQYVALVHGILTATHGMVRRPIKEFGSGRMGIDHRGGKASCTTYDVAESLPAQTVLTVTPTTGRRHQVRVHLYSIGHPVVGDLRYGPLELQRRFPRLMLHARKLRFRLPSGNELTIEAPESESFTATLTRLRGGEAMRSAGGGRSG